MNDVNTHQTVHSKVETELEVSNWIRTGTIRLEILTRQDIEDRLRRKDVDKSIADMKQEELQHIVDFEENFRCMQSDYRDETVYPQPVIIKTVSKWKFWRFWK